MPNISPKIDDEYLQIINSQHEYLVKLKENFNSRCKEITAQAQAQLNLISADKPEERKKLFENQKELLSKALEELKNKTSKSEEKTRKKLEELNTKREKAILNNIQAELEQ